MCRRKKRYRTISDVNKAIKNCQKERDEQLDYYECPICKGYHITKAMDFYEYIKKSYRS